MVRPSRFAGTRQVKWKRTARHRRSEKEPSGAAKVERGDAVQTNATFFAETSISTVYVNTQGFDDSRALTFTLRYTTKTKCLFTLRNWTLIAVHVLFKYILFRHED